MDDIAASNVDIISQQEIIPQSERYLRAQGTLISIRSDTADSIFTLESKVITRPVLDHSLLVSELRFADTVSK